MKLNPRDLVEPETPDVASMPSFARAHQVLLATAVHQNGVTLTFRELGLSSEHLKTLLGTVFVKLYEDENGQVRVVPDAIPKTVLNLIGVALTKLASWLARQMKADDHFLKEAYSVIEQAAARQNQSPY